MKKWVRNLWLVLAAFILTVVVPVIINELYKRNTGYLTVWGAADVLSYYGTVLGACVTVGALIVTIQFTKKQIKHDNYIKTQEEKWDRIESLISSSLDRIHPARIAEIILNVTSGSYNEAITAFHLYSLQAKTALDSLFGYISSEDNKRLEPLLSDIQKAVEEYCGIASKLDSQYQKLRLLERRRNVLDSMARQNQQKSYAEEISSDIFLRQTSGLDETEIRAEIRNLSDQLSSLCDNSYRNLLEKKRSTFSEIHDEWIKEADSMLRFWRDTTHADA